MNNADGAELAAYYAKRAGTYEQVYDKPERQADLAVMKERVREALRDHQVLEIACGTGYWTEQLAQSAASVLATDINQEMIDVAKAKNLPADKVRFALADAFDLQTSDAFSACFAGFWWSHVKKQDQSAFLQQLRAKLGKDTYLVLIDNVYVEGSSTSIARTDLDGNTHQIRTLADGTRHEVVKNFPTDSALRKKMATTVKDIRILRLEHYWMLTGRLK
ncbi:MAG: methyltransferase [Burkholderiales bacterium RIFCSPLOWO2_02_FULL_57_36]|nr:MAG: methyltransferase [Burkholderiales bacterium RIFCSPLOWO2_02_FULL_57_36]